MGYFNKFNASEGVKFMDNATKGDFEELADKVLKFSDYDFIKNSEGDYAVMAFDEFPGKFYFGNAFITEALHQIDADNMKAALLAGDARITFFKRVAEKSKRTYWAFELTEK